jgi:uncharacterized protein (DUF2267 family)
VDKREFFGSVAEQTALSREEAADLTRATLQTLAQHKVVGQLPGEFRDLVTED